MAWLVITASNRLTTELSPAPSGTVGARGRPQRITRMLTAINQGPCLKAIFERRPETLFITARSGNAAKTARSIGMLRSGSRAERSKSLKVEIHLFTLQSMRCAIWKENTLLKVRVASFLSRVRLLAAVM